MTQSLVNDGALILSQQNNSLQRDGEIARDQRLNRSSITFVD